MAPESGATTGILRVKLIQRKAHARKRVKQFYLLSWTKPGPEGNYLVQFNHMSQLSVSTPLSFSLSHFEVHFLSLATEKKFLI